MKLHNNTQVITNPINKVTTPKTNHQLETDKVNVDFTPLSELMKPLSLEEMTQNTEQYLKTEIDAIIRNSKGEIAAVLLENGTTLAYSDKVSRKINTDNRNNTSLLQQSLGKDYTMTEFHGNSAPTVADLTVGKLYTDADIKAGLKPQPLPTQEQIRANWEEQNQLYLKIKKSESNLLKTRV